MEIYFAGFFFAGAFLAFGSVLSFFGASSAFAFLAAAFLGLAGVFSVETGGTTAFTSSTLSS